jgi:allophanate hydrolase subunit 2
VEGCDINAVDKGGRTLMHVIATRDSMSLDKINYNFNYKTSLHSTDSVLQWTPLQYAIKLENWFTVEWLLKSNVDRYGLDMIGQRAQGPNYTDQIIMSAVKYGLLLLLEFLYNIVVDIHQASDED